MSNSHYILIDAKTRQPVPLPYWTSLEDFESVGVHDIIEGVCQCTTDQGPIRILPETLGLALITEADFMAEQNNAT